MRPTTPTLGLVRLCVFADWFSGFGHSGLRPGDPIEPEFANAYCGRGQACLEIGDYRRAIQDTTKAIGLKPALALAYFHRARAYLKENRLDRALADLDEAVKLDSEAVKLGPDLEPQTRPIYFEIYRRQGSGHFAAQRWDKAIASFEKASVCDKSESEQFSLQLAQAYAERGFDHARHHEFEEAVRDLKRAFELDKDNAQNHYLYGLTCCRMAQACHDRGASTDEKEQWETAVKYLNLAIWLDPEMDAQVRHPLADARRKLDAVFVPASVTQHTGQQ